MDRGSVRSDGGSDRADGVVPCEVMAMSLGVEYFGCEWGGGGAQMEVHPTEAAVAVAWHWRRSTRQAVLLLRFLDPP